MIWWLLAGWGLVGMLATALVGVWDEEHKVLDKKPYYKYLLMVAGGPFMWIVLSTFWVYEEKRLGLPKKSPKKKRVGLVVSRVVNANAFGKGAIYKVNFLRGNKE